mmetsp:Transcript_4702/g.15712  ORF Transcript_4702/g.15712 Transcript_4702/m.15712 type:complete len:203 (-) Transcript_4702:1408-2016(-)
MALCVNASRARSCDSFCAFVGGRTTPSGRTSLSPRARRTEHAKRFASPAACSDSNAVPLATFLEGAFLDFPVCADLSSHKNASSATLHSDSVSPNSSHSASTAAAVLALLPPRPLTMFTRLINVARVFAPFSVAGEVPAPVLFFVVVAMPWSSSSAAASAAAPSPASSAGTTAAAAALIFPFASISSASTGSMSSLGITPAS